MRDLMRTEVGEAPSGSGTLTEETYVEDRPSAQKRKTLSLLVSFLRQSFTDAEVHHNQRPYMPELKRK